MNPSSMLKRINEKVKEHTGAPLWLLTFVRGLYQVVDWLFDNPLYVAAIVYFGPVKAFVVMTLASAVLNSLYLLIYQRTGIDWLGISAIKTAALATEERSIIGRLWNKRFRFPPFTWIYRVLVALPVAVAKIILWAINRGHGTAFLVLSVFQDSFVTTAYFRHGKTGPLDRSDWKIFLTSLVISNIYWTVRWGVIVEIAIALWKRFGAPLAEGASSLFPYLAP